MCVYVCVSVYFIISIEWNPKLGLNKKQWQCYYYKSYKKLQIT